MAYQGPNPLAFPWAVHVDPNTGEPFYHNIITNEVSCLTVTVDAACFVTPFVPVGLGEDLGDLNSRPMRIPRIRHPAQP